MDRKEIIEKLKGILLSGERFDKEAVMNADEDTELVTGLGLTSFGLLYVVVLTEETFGIFFDNVLYNDFFTVGDLVDYIEKKLNCSRGA